MATKKKADRPRRRLVWESEWDGGGMASSGVGCVYEKGGRFYFRGTDEEPGGPYPTLVDAVKRHQLHYATPGVFSISSPVLLASEVARLLEFFPDEDEDDGEGYGLLVNGEAWEYDVASKTFQPAADEPTVIG